jgi:hypothetical protein
LVSALVLPWLLLGVMLARSPNRPASASPPRQAAHPGRWGRLSAVEIELRAPERITPNLCRTNLSPWFIPRRTAEEAGVFLTEAGCDPSAVPQLLQTAQPMGNGLQMLPPLDFLLGLSAPARARIYFRLGESAQNQDQFYAFRWRPQEWTNWLAESQFEPATRQWLERLAYTDGQYHYFADEAALTERLSGDGEKVKLVEALTRTKALIVTLHVGPNANIMEMAEYWGAGGRVREVLPILESLARLPEGGDTDIVNLLPPFADVRLNTYPRLDGPRYDCHWSAYNFFNITPDDRLLNGVELTRVHQERYVMVSPAEARLGDLVLFLNREGQAVHSSVYVADDIVFTKNGASRKKPWVLMKMADVQNIFWQLPTIAYARLKTQS